MGAREPLGATRRNVGERVGGTGSPTAAVPVLSALPAARGDLLPPPVVLAGVVLIALGLGLRWLSRRGQARPVSPARERAGIGRSREAFPSPACVDRAPAPGSGSALEPALTVTYPADVAGPLTRTLDRSRRLLVAEARLGHHLDHLPLGEWMVEPYVLVGGRRLPFLVIGPTGLFALAANAGRWSIDELAGLAETAEHLAHGLPSFDGPARAAICLAFASTPTRECYGGTTAGGRGGWVLDVDVVGDWLGGFEPAHGIDVERLKRLDRAAGPDWQRGRVLRLPADPRFG